MYDDKKFRNSSGDSSRPKGLFLFLIVLLSIVALVSIVNLTGSDTVTITLKEFESMVQKNPDELENVVFKEGKGFEYTKKGDPKGIKYFVPVLDKTAESDHITDLIFRTGAKPKAKNKFVSDILPHLLIVLGVFVLIYFLFFRKLGQRGEGFMSFGKSRAKLVNPEVCEITFDNVAGIDEAVDEVKEVVNFLKNPHEYNKLGGRLPRGILLVGPPGVGKTLLAKAIAGEAGVPFFSISGSDFVELFVGVGASRVRDLFQRAKEKAPAIIFLDELDAIGRRRGTGLGGGHDEREQTLNSILVEMDGFERQSNVIVIAATNREDVLDPALLRPGRFDRQIYVDLPDINGRDEILKVHARKIIMSGNVDLKILARATPMASGADLENILNEAALIGVMDGKEEVDLESLEKAREKVFWGREKKSRVMDEEDRRATALHESGHAICAKLLTEVDPLHKVSIIPRGRALGMTMMLPEKDQYSIGKKKFFGNIIVILAGRATEELYADDITSGAADDLGKATRLVRKMVCEWGMSDVVGLVNYNASNDRVFIGSELTRERGHSETTQQTIDKEVNDILNAAYNKAKTILADNKEILLKIVDALLELETLDSDQVESIFQGEDILKEKKSVSKEEKSSDSGTASTEIKESKPEDAGGEGLTPAADLPE